MNILLTGSNGFVGSNFINVCSVPNRFRFVYRCSSQIEPSLSNLDNIESYALGCGIDSKTNWGTAFENIDAVIHLAALAHCKNLNSYDYHNVNTEGTLKLATKACEAGVKRFVYISSIGVLGSLTDGVSFNADSFPEPHNCYSQSKYEAELGLKKIAEETGLEVVIVRPTLVYGPNAPGNFGMLTKLVRKLPVLPFGLANNRRDFISVQNLADLLITCATHPNAAGHTFLASDSETVSIKEFTNAIAKGLGKKVFQLPVPVVLMRLAGKLIGKSDMIEQLYGNLEVDSSNIKEVLDWTPPYTMAQSMSLLKHTDK